MWTNLGLGMYPILILFSAFLLHCGGLEQKVREEITHTLQTSLKCHRNPGMAVGVIKDGKIIYSNGFGVKNIDTNAPVTDETLFGIASITKSFSAALLVKLLNQNTNLTLKSRVVDLLGDQFVMPDELRTRETTFEDILSHRTAMLKYNSIRFTNLTRDNVLGHLRFLATNEDFRVSFVYNNIMYGVASKISEIIGDGKKWEDLITDNLFKPLGMGKSTFASRIDFSRDDLAKGYIDWEEPKKYERVTPTVSRRWSEMCGSGSIISSVKDMTKWMGFHLSKGKNDKDKQVMKSSLVSQLHEGRFNVWELGHRKPQFPITSVDSVYALGLRIGYHRGYKMISHSGSTWGYASFMIMLPTENIGVVILMNNGDPGFVHRHPIKYYLLDQALGIEPWINSTTICSFPKPWKTTVSKPTFRPRRNHSLVLKIAEHKEYEGEYSNPAAGTFTVQYNDTLDALVASYGWGTFELLLWPQSQDDSEERFYLKGIGPYFPPDRKPLYFIPHPSKSSTVVGIWATFIEEKRPAILCKREHIEICKHIVAKVYPKQKVMDRPTCPQSGSGVIKHHKFCVVTLLILAVFLNS